MSPPRYLGGLHCIDSCSLVGNAAPPSVVLFAYTVPSIIIRMFVPYITFPDLRKIFSRTPEYSKIGNPETQSKEVDYVIRLSICAASSLFGLQLLAWANSVPVRVLGIAFASLSSNLGDMYVIYRSCVGLDISADCG